MKSVTHSEHGLNCYVGSWRAGWPFNKLTITDSTIELLNWPQKYTLKLSEIDSITKGMWLLLGGKGIKINHHNSTIPNDIQFWSFNPKKLIQKLNATNVPIVS